MKPWQRRMDTVDPVHHDSVSGKDGFLVFSRQNGLLGSHAIVEGRHAAEKIARVPSFNGQSLRGPAGATGLLVLSETASDRAADGTVRPSSGRAQGAGDGAWPRSCRRPRGSGHGHGADREDPIREAVSRRHEPGRRRQQAIHAERHALAVAPSELMFQVGGRSVGSEPG